MLSRILQIEAADGHRGAVRSPRPRGRESDRGDGLALFVPGGLGTAEVSASDPLAGGLAPAAGEVHSARGRSTAGHNRDIHPPEPHAQVVSGPDHVVREIKIRVPVLGHAATGLFSVLEDNP